ncbi:MAG: TlpA family protein disulfide reductase [Thermoplasmata archaeon]|nr:TlpA family protein disulfide reductase [Thermoplasmata archaeon]
MKQSQIILIAIAVAVVVALATLVYLNSGEGQQPYDGGDDNNNLPLAADFSLPVVDDGGLLQLSSLRGKVVIIDFMATWCSPCATQIEYLKTISDEYSTSDVVILSVDVDNDEGENLLSNYKNDKGITWDVLRNGGSVASETGYEVTNIPTIVIVDQEGHIAFREVGITKAADLQREIDRLL